MFKSYEGIFEKNKLIDNKFVKKEKSLMYCRKRMPFRIVEKVKKIIFTCIK